MLAKLDTPLALPCGAVLNNRIAKAAMTEGLATPDGKSTPELERLYETWSMSGAGMLLTGNVIVDSQHLERPGNIVIDRKPDADTAERLSRLAKAGTKGGNHFWAQLSHAGRQTQKPVNPSPKSPSNVKVALPGGQFGTPEPLTVEEISDLVTRWATAAKACQDAGFTGIQIHAAHGYLISQFLSPRCNLRDDQYGGSLENRARFLLDIVAATRKQVGAKFPICVKLNSADFQKGGFEFEDSLTLVQWLEAASVDLIEISGGTYEQPKLLGKEGIEPEQEQVVAPSTAAREAYFVDFAKSMQTKVNVPLMVTGGFRKRSTMEHALKIEAADVIGIGRPMCLMSDAPKQILEGLKELPRFEDDLRLIPNWLGFMRRFQLLKAVDGFASVYWFYQQIWMLAHEGKTDPEFSIFKALGLVESRNRSILKERAKMLNP